MYFSIVTILLAFYTLVGLPLGKIATFSSPQNSAPLQLTVRTPRALIFQALAVNTIFLLPGSLAAVIPLSSKHTENEHSLGLRELGNPDEIEEPDELDFTIDKRGTKGPGQHDVSDFGYGIQNNSIANCEFSIVWQLTFPRTL